MKEFLIKKNLAFKVLLLLDNVGSHDLFLQILHPNIEVMFLPPNTTSVLQPMDQSIMATFKTNYLKRVMDKMLKVANHQSQGVENSFKVKQFWKEFNISDSFGLVDESWNEIESLTLNRCWSKLLPKFVIHTTREPTYDECVKSLLRLAREIGGEGFEDMNESDVQEIIRPTAGLTAEDIDEILNDPQNIDEENKESEEVEEPALKAAKISKIINHIQNAIEEALNSDPIMTRSLRFKHDCGVALATYQELYQDIVRRKQTTIADYFRSK